MIHAKQNPMEPLVTTGWLSQHLGDPDLVVLDCTVLVKMGGEGGFSILSGREDYKAGHIPGAGFADLLGELSDRESPYWVGLPSPEKFCLAMGALGVGDDSRVVLYDNNMTMWAARVWWMLRWVGFDRAALLDGGMKAWKAEGRALTTEPPNFPARLLTPALRPESIASQEEVQAALNDPRVWLIDALDENSYQAGHIPGAANIDARQLVDEMGRYKPLEVLAAMHEGERSARAITYCGGGVAASSNAFVMNLLGYTNVAVYAASMQEWAGNPNNPVTAGVS